MGASLSRFLLPSSAACSARVVLAQADCATAVIGRNGKRLANAMENFNWTF